MNQEETAKVVLAFQRAEDPEGSFAKLYAGYSRNVFAYCRSWSKRNFTKEDCQDLVNDVFVQVWLSLHQLHEPTNFRSWLLVVTSSICGKELTRRLRAKRIEDQRTLPLDDVEEPPVMMDFDASLEQERQREWLNATAPKKLSSREREVITLVREGLATEEIAAKLRIRKETVRVFLCTAQRKLKLAREEAKPKERK